MKQDPYLFRCQQNIPTRLDELRRQLVTHSTAHRSMGARATQGPPDSRPTLQFLLEEAEDLSWSTGLSREGVRDKLLSVTPSQSVGFELVDEASRLLQVLWRGDASASRLLQPLPRSDAESASVEQHRLFRLGRERLFVLVTALNFWEAQWGEARVFLEALEKWHGVTGEHSQLTSSRMAELTSRLQAMLMLEEATGEEGVRA